jgi:hypothetical protein
MGPTDNSGNLFRDIRNGFYDAQLKSVIKWCKEHGNDCSTCVSRTCDTIRACKKYLAEN